jgi:hypothetical protein
VKSVKFYVGGDILKEFTLKIALDENGIVSGKSSDERYINCMEFQNQRCP